MRVDGEGRKKKKNSRENKGERRTVEKRRNVVKETKGKKRMVGVQLYNDNENFPLSITVKKC